MLPQGIGGAFYINLDHRTDRRQEFEGEIERMGLSCERFSAIKHSSGTIGCGYSHLAILKEARARGYESVLIFEDDFQFLVEKDTFWSIIDAIKDVQYDVIMISYALIGSSPHSEHLLKVRDAQTTSGYIVHSRMYDTLIDLNEYAVKELIKTGKHWIYAVDQIWKRLQPTSEWFATKIRIGKQRASYSDVANKFMDYHDA